MGSAHQVQHAVRTALHRQVQEADQLWRIAVNLDDIVGELDRMAGGKADPIDTVDRRNQTQQIGKAAGGAVVVFPAPGVHVLPEQVDFTHALRRQLGDFKQDIVAWAAHFLAAGVRHHAVGAVLVATFHDGNKGAWAFGARFRQAVELFDFREADIDDWAAVASYRVNHFRQTVQGLRPKNNIDVMGALANMVAFLRSHAAANADDQVGILLFQQLPAS